MTVRSCSDNILNFSFWFLVCFCKFCAHYCTHHSTLNIYVSSVLIWSSVKCLSFISFSCLSVIHYSRSNVTFHYRRSSAAYFGGMCSVSRGVGVNEVRLLSSSIMLYTDHRVWLQVSDLWFPLCSQYGTTWSMAASLSQSLAQNLGIQWDPASKRSIHENRYC